MAGQELSTRDLAQTGEAARPEPDAADLDDGDGTQRAETQTAEAEDAGTQTTDARAADGTQGTGGALDDEALRNDARTGEGQAAAHEPLLAADEGERYRLKWREIQTRFVDEPQQSVEQADMLVADLMQRLAAVFSDERGRLEAQWEGGDDVSTEDLRVALTRYRSFFDRLLSA